MSVITSGKKKNHEHFKTSKTCISLRIYQWLDYQSYVDVCANINDPWLDYQSHFDVCANINDWTDEEKCLYLAVFLRDRHKGCWGTYLQMQDKILEEMFSPCNQTDLHRTQLRERRQKAHESLLELGQDDVMEILVKVQFVDGLASADMQLRVKQGRPLNLKYAVRHAVDLGACNKAESKRNEGCGYLWSKSQINETQECDTQTLTLIKNMQTMLSELQQEVIFSKAERRCKTSAYRQRDLSMSKCFSCGRLGHIVKYCRRRNASNNKSII